MDIEKKLYDGEICYFYGGKYVDLRGKFLIILFFMVFFNI